MEPRTPRRRGCRIPFQRSLRLALMIATTVGFIIVAGSYLGPSLEGYGSMYTAAKQAIWKFSPVNKQENDGEFNATGDRREELKDSKMGNEKADNEIRNEEEKERGNEVKENEMGDEVDEKEIALEIDKKKEQVKETDEEEEGPELDGEMEEDEGERQKKEGAHNKEMRTEEGVSEETERLRNEDAEEEYKDDDKVADQTALEKEDPEQTALTDKSIKNNILSSGISLSSNDTSGNEAVAGDRTDTVISHDEKWTHGLEQFINEDELIGEMKSTIHSFPFGSIKDQCDQLNYKPLDRLPKTSVILTFHNSESLENLLKTVRSILKWTPKELLEEIVLIADNVAKDELTTVLDQQVAAMNSSILTLKRSTEQLGLIKARLWGVRVARGPIVVCLDSHMEVQERWLEPMVIEIYNDPHAMVSPSLDWMSFDETDKRWTMKHGGNNWKTFFDWTLAFGWQAMNPHDWSQQKEHQTKAFISPMSIGNFAIAKKWFTEIGEFDEGMEMWGGDNVELPLRVWLFGGRMLNSPCSHVAHYEKPGSRAYRARWTALMLQNNKRIAEVWLDDYKKYFYYYCPDMKVINAGNLTARLELKKKAKYDFKWFLDNVYPELGMYDDNSLAYNGAENLAFPNKCIHGGGQSEITLYNCMKGNTIRQAIYWNMEGHLRYPTYNAVSTFDIQKKRYIVSGMGSVSMHKSNENTVWFHWMNGPLIDPMKQLCLEAINDSEMTLRECQFKKKSQQWRFRTYTDEYLQLFNRMSDIKYKSAYLFQMSKLVKSYQRERWSEVQQLIKNFTSVLLQWPTTRTIKPEEAALL